MLWQQKKNLSHPVCDLTMILAVSPAATYYFYYKIINKLLVC